MALLHQTANTVLFSAHADRGHFNWAVPLARAVRAAGLKAELWTNGMCTAWAPDGAFDVVEGTSFGEGKQLHAFVGAYKSFAGNYDSDREARKAFCDNEGKGFASLCEKLGVDPTGFALMSTGGQAGQDAFAARAREPDVAFVVWEANWGAHAQKAAQAALRPHMGLCPSYRCPYRAAYAEEPIPEFDGTDRVRNTQADIRFDGGGSLDVAFITAACLQGRAKDTGGRKRFGAFLPPRGESGDGDLGSDLAAWLAKEGRVTVISLGSQSCLQGIAPWAEADLLKGCLAGSPRVLVASAAVPEDAELRRAEAEGRLRAEAWLPLLAVLGHSSVGCFVSHCGANSTHESLAQGKAIVPLPFFDDQFYVAGVVEEAMGYASQEGYTPLRKAALRQGEGAGVAAVQAAVRRGLAVPAEALAKLRERVWKEDGVGAVTRAIKAAIKAAPKVRKPKFGKVGSIKPDDGGLNLLVKVVKAAEEDTSSKGKAWEAVVGDASGVATLRIVDAAHAELCRPGASLRVQNARVLMMSGFVRVIVDKWGVLKAADSPLELEVKTDRDVSAVEYELAK